MTNNINIIDIIVKYFVKNNVIDIIVPVDYYYFYQDHFDHDDNLDPTNTDTPIKYHILLYHLRELIIFYNRLNEPIREKLKNIFNNMKEIFYSIIFRSCSLMEIKKLKGTLKILSIEKINNISIDSISSTEKICELLGNDNDEDIKIYRYEFYDEKLKYIKPAVQSRYDNDDDEDDLLDDKTNVFNPMKPEELFIVLKNYGESYLLFDYNRDVDIKTLEQLIKYLSDLYEDIKTNHNITIIKDFDKEFNLLSTIIDNINDYILNKLSDAKLLNDKLNILYEFYLNLRLFLNNLILIICFYINNEHNLCIKPKINVKEEDIYRYFMNGYNIGNLSK
jgi:hypothetical protein